MAKKAKLRLYELLAKTANDSFSRNAALSALAKNAGDSSLGNTVLLAQLSLDDLKTIAKIAKALANDKSGALLKTVKKHVKFWESARNTSVDWLLPESYVKKLSGRKPAKRGGRQ